MELLNKVTELEGPVHIDCKILILSIFRFAIIREETTDSFEVNKVCPESLNIDYINMPDQMVHLPSHVPVTYNFFDLQEIEPVVNG